MPLKNLPLVIVDIETTGSSASNSRITEIGMLKIRDGRIVDRFESLLDPGMPIPPSITQLTGITDAMVEGQPSFYSLKDDIREFCDGSIFVAHNARFDYSFFRYEFERLGETFTSRVLCSVRLSRQLFKEHKRHNLSSIVERYNITIENRHRAMGDAFAVWEFFEYIDQHVESERQDHAIAKMLKRPSIPPNLKTPIEDIPEQPGVYFFNNDVNMPIYIGKAKDLRQRVLSHFTQTLRSDKEMRICQQVTHIDVIPTQGELAALLLESYHIKKDLPLYNRRSRRCWQLTALKIDESDEYHRLLLDGYKSITKEDLPNILMIFKTRKDAGRFLEEIAREYKLCKTLLGLEKKHGSNCFYHQIKMCHGACEGQELPIKYNLRLKEALLKHQKIRWPFDGPVMITESSADQHRGEVIVIDHWIVQDAFRFDGEAREPLFELDYRFDLDAFRILYGYIHRRKNLNLKVLDSATHNELVSEM